MSEPETLNYQETLAIIETFMIKSGLRDFCTTVCQGQCCKHCIKNNSCFENEGKRLPCSLYICRDIKLHLGSTSSKFFKYYLAINTILRKQYHSITRNPDFDDYFYFRPPSNKIIDELKVPKKLLLLFTKELYSEWTRKRLIADGKEMAKRALCYTVTEPEEFNQRMANFHKLLTAQT